MIAATDSGVAKVAPRLPQWAVTAAAAAIVIAAWVVLELWGLGAIPFHTKGEPREALVVWEMTHGGGWILPRRGGVELPSKPPLFHWLAALTALEQGETDEWSIRFPSAALSLLGVLGVLLTGAALWNPRAGLIGALALLTMFEWARAGTNARVDMVLTVGLELAFLSVLFFLRSRDARWLPPLYIGVSIATLGKGPVGIVLPGLTTLVMLAVRRDLTPLRQMRLIRGALAVIVIAGSWYALAYWIGGAEFFQKQILSENFLRVVDSAEDVDYVGHRHSALYLLGTLVLGLLPWTVFVPAVAMRLWRQRGAMERSDPRIFLVVWIVVVFTVYAVAVSKRSVYLLGLYPALALLLGWWADEAARDGATEASATRRVLPWSCGLLAAAFGLVGLVTGLEALGAPVSTAVQHVLSPSAQPFAPVVGTALREGYLLVFACVLIAASALLAAIRAARTGRWLPIYAGAFFASAAAIVCTSQVILPAIANASSLRPFMADVRRIVGPASDLSFYKEFSYGAVYYWRRHIPIYDGAWAEDAPHDLLMTRAQWAAAPPEARQQYDMVPIPRDGRMGDADRLVLVRRLRTQ